MQMNRKFIFIVLFGLILNGCTMEWASWRWRDSVDITKNYPEKIGLEFKTKKISAL